MYWTPSTSRFADRGRGARTWLPVAALLLGVAGVMAGDETDKQKPWLTSLEAAMEQARPAKQPVFAQVGAAWCGWCRKLAGELRQPDVQKELERWTLVRLDVDKSPAEARTLGVGPVPALRILTASGQVVAAHDGYLPAADLLAWLREHYDTGASVAVEDLTGNEPPDAEAVARLVKTLRHSDPTLREAATRRLLRHPAVAAVALVQSFADGNLAARLAVLEVLHEWQAPLEEIDPWQPETITAQRLETLRGWAAVLKPAGSVPTSGPAVSHAALLADIDALLQADTAVTADAIRERLARAGRALLPEVYERLKAATTDSAREALTTLRYRLVATDELVLTWPGGLKQLAATDAPVRHRAAEVLARRAQSADGPLLLELFSDPDPLVREISLRALRNVGGPQATAALIRLLHDPEPNVRAAVLKELAEKPSPQLVAPLAEFVTTEADPDLVVHAVRVLRGTQGDEALTALSQLLSHASWRVRAESAEALGELLRGGSSLTGPRKAEAYVALIQRLDDEDGFVVSRAIKALSDVDLVAAVEPLVRAAVRLPEIAPEALKLLSHANLRDRAVAPLRELCRHEHAQVRSAAVAALASFGTTGLEDVLPDALADADSRVRLAAARTFYSSLVRQRPAQWTTPTDDAAALSDFPALGQPSLRATSRPKEPSAAAWLSQFRGNEQRPAWMRDAVGPLRAMLAEESAETRLAAALPLIALGQDDALSLVENTLQTAPQLVRATAPVLAWLPAAQRVELFELIRAQPVESGDLHVVAQALASLPDDTSAELLWRLVGDQTADEDLAAMVETSLRQLYFGKTYYDPGRVSAEVRKRVAEAARPRALAGPELQRVVALVLLLAADPPAAAEAAKTLVADNALSQDLRRDTFQILLLSQSATDGRQSATAALVGGDTETRKVALRYLGGDAAEMRALRGNRFWLVFNNPALNESTSWVSGQKIVPKVPAGLTPESVRPLLSDPDAEVAAYGGYFLALLGEHAGREPLVKFWREHQKDNNRWRRLVYRAIAALNDDAQTPVLEEIYRSYGQHDYEVREFYWTIRVLEGPQALALRKRIRQDVGMDFLR